ncbi:ABC-three component system protein [Zavarzinella formosa]|uniref:ABC-three component system protein n=1 Tax=Zavarzinella formosa TaxID=360055 RepID=UPI0002EF4506|nr:ABC-three component system protein [Zavarzinella formosa]
MDQLTRAFYELKFRNAFLENRGEAFQDLFSSIMENRYPGDFIRTRPWGNQGDRKNDGYVRSMRTLFQVYAPNELSESITLAKIDEDFQGAIPFWRAHFDQWVFVHNSAIGLGPGVERKLLDLDSGNQNIRVRSWGFEELRRVVFELGISELISLLGPIPSRTDLVNVQFPEVEMVLRTLENRPTPLSDEIQPVPPRKLEANSLSDAVVLLLKAGLGSSNKVRDYFNKYYDPKLGDRVAQAFRGEYESLRNARLSPDDIFVRLQLIGNGTTLASPSRQAATLTVLAYLFEECEIFERPPEEAVP